MKRVFFLILTSLVMICGKAQDVQFMFGEQCKVFFETTTVRTNSTTFAYIESTYKGGTMLKLFHEQKFWETPLYIHAEYQTSFSNHTFLMGPSYSFNHKKGYVSFAALCRIENTVSPQLSNSYLVFWGWGDFNGYNHLWINKTPSFVGEERLNINVYKNIAISAILDITYFGGWDFTPYVGLRYRL